MTLDLNKEELHILASGIIEEIAQYEAFETYSSNDNARYYDFISRLNSLVDSGEITEEFAKERYSERLGFWQDWVKKAQSNLPDKSKKYAIVVDGDDAGYVELES